MKKVMVMVYVMIVGLMASASDKPSEFKWSEVKPIYEKAIKTNYRVNLVGCVCWEQFYPQLSNDMERAEAVKLFLLAEDGSYSDLVLPSLYEYLTLYHKQIMVAKENKERQKYFKKELEGLVYIFKTLNNQVKTYHDFDEQATRDFTAYLGHTPASRADDDQWPKFIELHPKYKGQWPGLYSSAMDDKGSRSWDNYFQSELLQAEKELKELPREVSLPYYQMVMRRLTGELKNSLTQ